MAMRSAAAVLASRGAIWLTAKAAELEPRLAPLAPTRNTSGKPRPVSRSATAPASQYTRPASLAAWLAGIDKSEE